MTKQEIEERLDKNPFQPFRIKTSDGKHYDVTNPDLVVAMATRVFIALPENRWTLIALGQVTGLEGLAAA